jgi:hypothetical protein
MSILSAIRERQALTPNPTAPAGGLTATSTVEKRVMLNLFRDPPARPDSREPKTIQIAGENVPNPAHNRPGAAKPNKLGQVADSGAPALVNEVIARRYFVELIKPAEVYELAQTIAEVTKTQGIIEWHSPTMQAEREKKLADIYARNPNGENLQTLRHEKSLSASDHNLVQFRQRQHINELCAQATPVMREVFARATECLVRDAQGMMRHDDDLYTAWSLTTAYSDLAKSVAASAKGFAALADCRGDFDYIPGFIAALVKVANDATATAKK